MYIFSDINNRVCSLTLQVTHFNLNYTLYVNWGHYNFDLAKLLEWIAYEEYFPYCVCSNALIASPKHVSQLDHCSIFTCPTIHHTRLIALIEFVNLVCWLDQLFSLLDQSCISPCPNLHLELASITSRLSQQSIMT